MIIKAISSLEKVMSSHTLDSFRAVERLTAARGERVSFQIAVQETVKSQAGTVQISLRSPLSRHTRLFSVEYVPCEMPLYQDRTGGDVITREPGLFPDVLRPLKKGEKVRLALYTLKPFWCTVELPEDVTPGAYPVYISLRDETGAVAKTKVIIDVKDAVLADAPLRFTQWFHCDSIADYFGVKMMSEKHWKLIERFLRTAVHTGVNMILTPIFTPPLDTLVGDERPTMQLVRVEKSGNDYTFDFAALDRWVALCRKCGITHFEMAHLFTQWGAKACPKIVVRCGGRDEKLFGWHVPSLSPLYHDFLRQFLPALVEHLEQLGVAENCYFHLSDEPVADPTRPDYQNYCKIRALVKPLLGRCKMMDAVSHVEFFDNGLVDYPVVPTDFIGPFLDRDLPERWCYTCCAQSGRVANRFLAFPSFRNRVSGLHFYLHNMTGYLQWGYNYYYSVCSASPIDPYRVTDGLHGYPGGDSFSVYPHENGAIESIRAVVFYEGLQDRRLLLALEQKIGAGAVHAMVESIAGGPVTFTDCLDAEKVQRIHDTAVQLLAE